MVNVQKNDFWFSPTDGIAKVALAYPFRSVEGIVGGQLVGVENYFCFGDFSRQYERDQSKPHTLSWNVQTRNVGIKESSHVVWEVNLAFQEK